MGWNKETFMAALEQNRAAKNKAQDIQVETTIEPKVDKVEQEPVSKPDSAAIASTINLANEGLSADATRAALEQSAEDRERTMQSIVSLNEQLASPGSFAALNTSVQAPKFNLPKLNVSMAGGSPLDAMSESVEEAKKNVNESVDPYLVAQGEETRKAFYDYLKGRVEEGKLISTEDLPTPYPIRGSEDPNNPEMQISFGETTIPMDIVQGLVADYNNDILHQRQFKEDAQYRNDWFLKHAGITEKEYRNRMADHLEGRLKDLKQHAHQFNTKQAEGTTGLGTYGINARSLGHKQINTGEIENALDLVEMLRKDDFSSGWVAGSDANSLFTLGILPIANSVETISALNKANKGEKLTDSEKVAVETWEIQQEANELIETLGGRSLSSSIGEGAAASSEFIVQMLATSGYGSGVKVATGLGRAAAAATLKRIATKGTSAFMKNALKEGAIKVANSVVVSAAKVPLMPMTYKTYTDKRMGQFSIGQAEKVGTGELETVINKAPQSAWRDAMHSGLETFMEIQSEDFGQMLDWGAKSLGASIARNMFGRSVGLSKTAPGIRNQLLRFVRQEGKISSFGSEVLSEAYGDAMVNTLEGNDKGWRQMATQDYWWQLAGVSALLSGGFSATESISNRLSNGDLRKSLNIAKQSRDKALSGVWDPELKKTLYSASRTDNLVERSRILGSIDWKDKKFDKTDVALTLDFLNAQTQLDVLSGSAKEVRRILAIQPYLDRISALQYANSGEIKAIEVSGGKTYFAQKYNDAKDTFTAIDVDGKSAEIPAGDVVRTLNYDISDVIAEYYANTFRVQEQQEQLQDILEASDDAKKAGFTDDQIVEMVRKTGLTVYNPGDRVELLNGEQVTINANDGLDYEVVDDAGNTRKVSFEEVLQDNSSVAEAQRSSASNDPTALDPRPEVQQARSEAREQAEAIKNLDDDLIYQAAMGDDWKTVYIVKGSNIVFDEESGDIDYDASDPRVEVQDQSGTRSRISIRDLKSIDEVISVDEAASLAGEAVQVAMDTVEADAAAAEQASETPIPMVGRSLTDEEANAVISQMEANAAEAPEIELTPENWDAQFGEDGIVTTPIGEVKMGENQYKKLIQRKRSSYFGMILPTLQAPDFVLEELDPKEEAERDTKLLFVKTFKKPNGGRYVHFESVTVKKDDREVSISSHEVNTEDLIKKMHNDKVVHLNDSFFDSEGRLIEPQTEGSDLVPTPNSSESKDTTSEPKNQEVAPKNVGAPEIPTLKNGQPDYNAMSEEMFVEQYVTRFGEKNTENIARNNIKSADKAITDLGKKIGALTDPNKLPELQAKLDVELARKARYVAILDLLGLSENAQESNSERVSRLKKENTDRIAQLFPDGLPNVESVILADIAGGHKMRWSDKVVNGAVVSRGLGSELGLADSNAERNRRVGLLSNDAPTPDEYAEHLRERLDAMGIRYEESELRDKVIDTYASVDTRGNAWKALESLAANQQTQEEALDYEEEQMRRAYEREQQKVQNTPDQRVDVSAEDAGHIGDEQMSTEDEVPFRVREYRSPLHDRVAEWENKLGIAVNIMESIDEVENKSAREAIQSGKRATGWFEPSTGEVMIYMPFVRNIGEIDKTIIHEIVAHKGLRQLLGEEKFGSLMDRVWNMMSEQDQSKYIAYPGVNGDTRKAADEYMAFLAEGVDLTEQDKNVWQKVVDFFREILAGLGVNIQLSDADLEDLIRASYQNLVRENRESVDRLENLGAQVDSEKGDVLFAVRDVLKGAERERAIQDLMKVTGRSRKTVVGYLKSESSLARVILDNDNIRFLDIQADDSVPSIWNNSDYPQGTVEFSNICRKRLPLTMIYQRLQEEFPNTVFDAYTLESIRETLKDNGVDVACGLCFVEDRRQLLGEIGKSFIDALNGDNVELNDRQTELIKKLKGSGDNYVPSLYELLTLDGMKKLRSEHPEVASSFIAYNNARGMQAGRLFQAYSAYHREILDYSPKRVESINNSGGLRIFSFSDFEAHHLIDLVQVLTDCAAKGIKVQGYTKVPEFAKAVKDTKMKLNRSLIAKGSGIVDDGYIPKRGEAVSPNVIDGKRLLLDTVEGIDVTHKDFFDSSESRSVGNIMVGINDEQIRLAMADPFIDYIIPFHSGLSESIRKKKGIGSWENYKLEQLEKKEVNGKLKNADKHGVNIYTEVLSDNIRTEKQFVERYLEVCREKEWTPKFHRFLDKDKDGNYVYTKGYYKFLLDFKLFDEKGRILPQEVVVPVFDNGFNKEILEDYVKGEESKVPNDDIYNKVKEDLGLDEDTRFRFIGETGAANLDKAEEATIRLDNLAVARQMEAEGKSAKAIKMATGWERGADDKWRYEVNDEITAKHIRGMKGAGLKKIHEARSARIKALDKFAYIAQVVGVDRSYDNEKILATSWPEAQKQNWLNIYDMYKDNRDEAIEDVRKARAEISRLTKFGKGEFMLYEVLGDTHNLFKEYPQLRNVKVILKPYKGGNDRGNYNRLTNTITIIDYRGIMENDKGEGSADTLVHELQHIIQSIEGFARGGNIMMDDPNKIKAKEDELAYQNEMFEDAVNERTSLMEQARALNDQMQAWWENNPNATWEDALADKEMFELNKKYSDTQEKLEEVRKRVETYERALESVEDFDTSLGVQGYKRLAGEVEARNVERRRNLSMGERRNSPAWETEDVARKDQIFIFDALAGENQKAQFRVAPEMDAQYLSLVEEGNLEEAKKMVDAAANAAGYNADESWKKAHRAPRKSEDNVNPFNTEELVPADYWTHPEWYTQIRHYQTDRESYFNMLPAINKYKRLVAEGKQDEADKVTVTMYRGVDKRANKKESTFRNGDWITPSRSYALLSAPEGNARVISQDVLLKDIWWDGNSINEWGYDDGANYVYQDTKNNRKSADAVTYDDNGNVIPLSKRFNKRSEDVRFRVAPTFYSNAANAVLGIKQEKATPEQWLKMIEKNGGLKAGEDKWIGLSDWLKDSEKKTLTKQEVLDYINENQIQIEEVEYGDVENNPRFKELQAEYQQVLDENDRNDGRAFDEMIERYGDDFGLAFSGYGNELHAEGQFGSDAVDYFLENRSINETRRQYTTDGLENKREIALTVPTIESWNENDEVHFGDAGEGRAIAWIRFGETTDKDGKRVLVIDEIQSKRHQEGREKGYRPSDVDKYLKDNNVEVVETGEFYEFYRDGELDRRFSKGLLHYNIKDAKNLYVAGYEKSDIPDAPFEKNWAELAMKRMLRYAAENGFDKVAWTTGNQQAERYDIGSVVDKIVSYTEDEAKTVRIYLKNNEPLNLKVDSEGKILYSNRLTVSAGQNLSDVVGKDVAVKILRGDGEDATIYAGKGKEYAAKQLSGNNLRIGGEGMKGFYDQILPSFMNKYGKKWGVKVQDVTLPNVEKAGRTMHSVDVTDSMRESVMQGQPMFRVAESDAERAEIERNAKENGTWLKAPNGADTNLTPEQWVTVRTKAFKNWFGDWESNAEIDAMQLRVLSWLSEENLEWARGKSRDEIIEHFGNTPEPIAYIPVEYLAYLGQEVTNNRVYSGMGYFIDHAVNHHPRIGVEKYVRIQEVLSNPDEVRAIRDNGNDSIVFIKEIDRFNAVVIEIEQNEDGQIVWHKSFYDQRKKPYTNKGVQLFSRSLEGGVSSIIRTEDSAHDSSLSVLNDTTNIQRNFVIPSDSSKIVDEHGEPKVVWHGGRFAMSDFVPLKNMHFGTKRAALERIIDREVGHDDVKVTQNGDGSYSWKYTDPYEESEDVVSKQTFETETDAYENAAGVLAKDVVVKPYFLNIRNIASMGDAGFDWAYTIEKARKGGHEGIVYKNLYEDKGSDSYIAFNPNQIKSAEGNTTFDPSDDIRFRVSPIDQSLLHAYDDAFAEVAAEYEALDKNDEGAMAAWRAKKRNVAQNHMQHITDMLGLPCEVFVINPYDESTIKEAHRRYIEARDRFASIYGDGMRVLNEIERNYDKFAKEIVGLSGAYAPQSNIAFYNIAPGGIEDKTNNPNVWRAILVHENTHRVIEMLGIDQSSLAELWDVARASFPKSCERIEEAYKEASQATKGEEFLAYAVESRATSEHAEVFFGFLSGNNSISEVMASYKNSVSLVRKYTEDILNELRNGKIQRTNAERSTAGGQRGTESREVLGFGGRPVFANSRANGESNRGIVANDDIRFSIADGQSQAPDKRDNTIANLRAKLRDQKLETREVAQQISRTIRKSFTSELVDKMGKRQFDGIIKLIETTDSRKDLEYALARIEEVVLDIQLKNEADRFNKYLDLRVQGESPRGVSIAANVDDTTRQFITIIKENLHRPIQEVDALLEEQGGTLAEHSGAQVLSYYQEADSYAFEAFDANKEIDNILKENTELRKERLALNKQGRSAEAKEISKKINANKGLIDALKAEMVQSKKSQLYYLQLAADDLQKTIEGGKEGFKIWVEEQQLHKQELVNMAWRDIRDGKKIPILDEQRPIWMKTKDKIRDFLFAPAYSFDYLLKMISVNAPNGEGALYDHFVRGSYGYVEARGQYYIRYERFKRELDEKAREIFGKGYKEVMAESNKPLDAEVSISYVSSKKDTAAIDENKIREGASEVFSPTIGEVMYAYMLSKMADGRVKLERMGLSEDKIDALLKLIPDKYIAFADWIQEEFLPSKRTVYNATHLRVFGTQMAQIENYVPLRVKKDFAYEEFDGSKVDKPELPSSITGSIIKRKRNTLPIDLHTNALDLMLDHGHQMEHWNAFTQIVHDTNILLSNTQLRRALDFRNPGLSKKLKQAALIAADSYVPDTDRMEKIAVSLSKVAAASKIAFRLNTAIKQVLSYPAFYAYSVHPKFWGYVTRNISPHTWPNNFMWALRNIPSFQERWLGRMAGDERLAQMTIPQLDKWIKSMGKYGMFANALVDALACANGAQAVYQYEKERREKLGYSVEEADRLAKIDAALAINKTQQSSEGLFLSRIQVDRTFFATMVSTFQNSNFAYLRKQLEGVNELYRDFRKEVDNRKAYYKDQDLNLSAEEIEKQAIKDVVNAKKKAVMDILTFAFILNTMWTLGNGLWKYALGDDDEEDNAMSAIGRGMLNSFTRNLSIGQWVETVAYSDYRGLNPSLLLSDFNTFIDRVEEVASGDVRAWDRTAAYIVASATVQFGGGVDLNSFVSMVEGVHGMLQDGANVEDIMLFLNAPRSQAKFIAGPPREGETVDEYQKRQAWIERKIESKIDKKQLKKWARNYRAYHDAEILGVAYQRDKSGNVIVPAIEELNTAYEAALSDIGITKAGIMAGNASKENIARAIELDIPKKIGEIYNLEQGLKSMVELSAAYDEQLRRLQRKKQEMVDLWTK